MTAGDSITRITAAALIAGGAMLIGAIPSSAKWVRLDEPVYDEMRVVCEWGKKPLELAGPVTHSRCLNVIVNIANSRTKEAAAKGDLSEIVRLFYETLDRCHCEVKK
jgi:hypothetical protein